jgi:hypothetical protein
MSKIPADPDDGTTFHTCRVVPVFRETTNCDDGIFVRTVNGVEFPYAVARPTEPNINRC